jgi:hypothetical protein
MHGCGGSNKDGGISRGDFFEKGMAVVPLENDDPVGPSNSFLTYRQNVCTHLNLFKPIATE